MLRFLAVFAAGSVVFAAPASADANGFYAAVQELGFTAQPSVLRDGYMACALQLEPASDSLTARVMRHALRRAGADLDADGFVQAAVTHLCPEAQTQGP